MTKLNQLLAVEKNVKAHAHETITLAHQQLQKQPLLSGIQRSYTPIDDEGETLPSESAKVQLRTGDAVADVLDAISAYIDIVASKDTTNTTAFGQLTLPGGLAVHQLPVSTLLFLEKQLVDLHTFIKKIPVLDPSEDWEWSDQALCWVTTPVSTVRSKKIPRNHVIAEATDRHPAQVQVWQEDVKVGTWKTVKYSGAIPASQVRDMLNRLAMVTKVVKEAREAANMTAVTDVSIGDAMLNFIFHG